jgi:hypothetical protein
VPEPERPVACLAGQLLVAECGVVARGRQGHDASARRGAGARDAAALARLRSGRKPEIVRASPLPQ